MLKLLLNAYARMLRVLMTLLMALMLVPVCIQIVSRFTVLVPRYIWTEEVARFCFVWIIMIGAMVAVRDGTHFVVDLLPVAKTKREERGSRLIVHVTMMLMAFAFTWYGFQFAWFGAKQHSEMSGINLASMYSSFPVAGVTWIVFLTEKIFEDVQFLRNEPSESQT